MQHRIIFENQGPRKTSFYYFRIDSRMAKSTTHLSGTEATILKLPSGCIVVPARIPNAFDHVRIEKFVIEPRASSWRA